MSRRIKALEAFLRIELIQRYPQGVKLTEVGKRTPSAPRPREQLARQRAIGQRHILPSLAQLSLGAKMEEFHALETKALVDWILGRATRAAGT